MIIFSINVKPQGKRLKCITNYNSTKLKLTGEVLGVVCSLMVNKFLKCRNAKNIKNLPQLLMDHF